MHRGYMYPRENDKFICVQFLHYMEIVGFHPSF